MLTRTLAIAWLTVREAIRSKFLVSLTSLLVAGLVGLPLLIAADNTLTGKIQVTLNYTLVFASAILSVATLWAACRGMSAEIEDRRLYLVITKPLHRHELWLGKWLGITGLNVALLTLTGMTLSLMTRQTLRHSGDSPDVKERVAEQYLMARAGLRPIAPDWSETVEKATNHLMQSGQVPETMTLTELHQKVIEELKIQQFTIPPSGEVQFSFRLPPAGKTGQRLLLDYRFDSSRPERSPVPARWLLGSGPTHFTHISVTNYPGIPVTLALDENQTSGSHILTLTYQRLDAGSQATLMMADKTREPELLIPHGSFEMNLVRGLFILLCRLAFLAALGLTAGCLLSTPVALSVAFFIIILMASAGYVESVATSGVFFISHEGQAIEQTRLDQVILQLFRFLHGITHPLTRLDPLPLLASGRLVGGDRVLGAFGWLVALYTPLTALAGIALFKRRELG